MHLLLVAYKQFYFVLSIRHYINVPSWIMFNVRHKKKKQNCKPSIRHPKNEPRSSTLQPSPPQTEPHLQRTPSRSSAREGPGACRRRLRSSASRAAPPLGRKPPKRTPRHTAPRRRRSTEGERRRFQRFRRLEGCFMSFPNSINNSNNSIPTSDGPAA